MSQETAPERPDLPLSSSRRDLLKAGAAGLCVMCLARSGVVAARGSDAGRGLIRPRKAAWFSDLGGGRLRCDLCPWQCELAPGQTGRCRVRRNHQGQGQTLAYANPVIVQEEPIERLPFFHALPGSRTLAVSTAGCNLGCKFCEVWDMAQVEPHEVHAYDMPPETVIEQAQIAGLRSISYAFGEPVVFYEYMLDIARQARAAGLLNFMHTGGFIRSEPLAELIEVLDAVNVDLKAFDDQFYRDLVVGRFQPILDTLIQLRRSGVHLEVTTIVIPGLNDDLDDIGRMCTWIHDKLGADTPLHLSRFYPLYQLTNLPQTPVSTLDQARRVAMESGLRHVYVGRVTGHEGENTRCPNCSHQVISRLGFFVDEVDIEDGRCAQCGHAISGLWEA
ncbi:MAG: AmmeMemoRadiSam system radical SAM enzyme [Gammaproteobacteria bacterium]|nr:AmmeMemoRadiSam system radical SAM enzyme [Gammaproteobacteria bacterium]